MSLVFYVLKIFFVPLTVQCKSKKNICEQTRIYIIEFIDVSDGNSWTSMKLRLTPKKMENQLQCRKRQPHEY